MAYILHEQYKQGSRLKTVLYILSLFFAIAGLRAQSNYEPGYGLFNKKEGRKNLYVDCKLGLGASFTDARTSRYFAQCWSFGLGFSAYYKHVILSWSLHYGELYTIKKGLIADDSYRIRPYSYAFFNMGSYQVNAIRNNFEAGYEIKAGKRSSLIPMAGFFIANFVVYNDGIHGSSYWLKNAYGLSLGCSYRRYFKLGEVTTMFVDLGAYANSYTSRPLFRNTGDHFYTFSISCGMKYRPQGELIRSFVETLLWGQTKHGSTK